MPRCSEEDERKMCCLLTIFTPCLGTEHPNRLQIPNRASTFEHYCYILSTFQPVVQRLSRQPLYSQPPTFPSIVNLIPQWLEDKEPTRPLRSHIPDAASRPRATNSSTFRPESLHKGVFSTHNILFPLKIIVLCSLGLFSATRWHTGVTSLERLGKIKFVKMRSIK